MKNKLLYFIILNLIFSLIIITPYTVSAQPAYAEFKQGYKITIDHTYIDDDLTNFPVLVKLNASVSLHGAEGHGIRFYASDLTTVLPFEVEEWNVLGNSYVWVNVTSIDNDVDTDFYIYYDTEESYFTELKNTSTWNSNYVFVNHMDDRANTSFYDPCDVLAPNWSVNANPCVVEISPAGHIHLEDSCDGNDNISVITRTLSAGTGIHLNETVTICLKLDNLSNSSRLDNLTAPDNDGYGTTADTSEPNIQKSGASFTTYNVMPDEREVMSFMASQNFSETGIVELWGVQDGGAGTEFIRKFYTDKVPIGHYFNLTLVFDNVSDEIFNLTLYMNGTYLGNVTTGMDTTDGNEKLHLQTKGKSYDLTNWTLDYIKFTRDNLDNEQSLYTTDSTFTNNATKNATNNPIESISKICFGQDFYGDEDRAAAFDYIVQPTSGMSANYGSISAWTYYDNTSDGVNDHYVFGVRGGTPANRLLTYTRNEGGDPYHMCSLGDTNSNSTIKINASEWHMITLSWDNGQGTFYYDGIPRHQFTYGDNPETSLSLLIGALNNNGDYISSFDGKIDEVRMSNINLSAAWIKADFHTQNQTDGFLTFGDAPIYEEEENTPPTVSHPNPANNSVDISVDTSIINVTIVDDDGDTFNWSIETAPDIGTNSSNDDTNGSKNCSISGLLCGTDYIWYINVTDGQNDTNISYTFRTEDCPDQFNNSCNSYEYGNWSFSEHCLNGVLEEEWLESNTTSWHVEQYDLPFNHTYVYNNSNGSADEIGFTYLNNSGMNRSQTLIWIYNNGTAELPLYQGPIYAFRNSSSYDTFLYGPNEIFALTFNGTGFVNTNDSTPVTTPLDAYNYAPLVQIGWHYDNETQEEEVWYYEIAPYEENGSWIKTIYNALCGDIDTKAWGTPDFSGLFTEPSGWCYEGNLSGNVSYADCQGFGLCVWNPYDQKNNSYFDFIEVWQLNYTLNMSASHPVLAGRPHMEFPVLNGSALNETLSEFMEAAEGNITYENISDFMQNVTNLMNMESRPAYLYKPISNWDQNDTIYYYSAVITNFSEVVNQSMAEEYWGYVPENILWLRIMDCTDANGTASCMIAIDVDNNGTWDNNDRAYYFAEPGGIEWEFHGPNWVPTYAPLSEVYYTWRNDVYNLHRYNTHVQYDFILPLNELVKNNSETLNYSDVFGLSIFTWNAENSYLPFWQNYNESNCSAYKNEDHDIIKNYFLNTTYIDPELDLNISDENIGRWGEGVITGELGEAGGYYDIEVNLSMYDNSTGEVITTVNSSMLGDNHSYEVNFTVNVSNSGTLPLSDIYVNMTFLNCSCSDWKYNITSTNIDEADLYYYNDSCYLIIYDPDIEPLAAATNWSIWMVINISECGGTNHSGTIQNNVSVNSSAGATASDNSNPLQWRILVERVDISATRPYPSVQGTSENVINILGIIFIISAILLILFIMKQHGVF